MKRTTIFLTADLDSQLKEMARRTRRTPAEIVREALSRYLQASALRRIDAESTI